MKTTMLIIFLWLPFWAQAQDVLLEKDLSKSVYYKKSGINHTYFGYIIVDASFYFFKKDSRLPVLPVRSHSFSAGYRWNRRIYGIYSAGLTASYLYDVFAIAQKQGKKFPTTLEHDKEKLQKHNLALEYYNRFTLKKEYSQLGVYLDAGLYGTLVVASRYKVQDENDDTLFYGDTKMVIIKKVRYIEPFNYGIIARLGYNRYALTTRYRLSNWIKKSYNFPQLPKMSIGLEVSLYW
jgi:hypothetical protein